MRVVTVSHCSEVFCVETLATYRRVNVLFIVSPTNSLFKQRNLLIYQNYRLVVLTFQRGIVRSELAV